MKNAGGSGCSTKILGTNQNSESVVGIPCHFAENRSQNIQKHKQESHYQTATFIVRRRWQDNIKMYPRKPV